MSGALPWDGLEQASSGFPQARRRQHAQRAGEHGGLVRKDVSEQIRAENRVEKSGVAQQHHRHAVDELVIEGHARMGPRLVFDDLVPERADFQHVGLVHVGESSAPPGRGLEAYSRDAPHLRLPVHHGVPSRGLAAGLEAPAGLAIVEAARQLADHDQVHSLHAFRTQWTGIGQGGRDRRGPQVRIQVEGLADAEQPRLGLLLLRLAVPARTAHGTQQDDSGFACPRQGLGRQGFPRRVDRRAADQRLLDLHVRGHAVEHLQRLGHDLGADAVARQGQHAGHGAPQMPRSEETPARLRCSSLFRALT